MRCALGSFFSRRPWGPQRLRGAAFSSERFGALAFRLVFNCVAIDAGSSLLQIPAFS